MVISDGSRFDVCPDLNIGAICALDVRTAASPQFPQAVSPAGMEHPQQAQTAVRVDSSCVIITSRAAEVSPSHAPQEPQGSHS